MVQYQLAAGASANTTLTVTAYATISGLQISGPSSPQVPAAALRCDFNWNNSGGQDTAVFTLKDETAATLGSTTLTVQSGPGSGYINFNMPNKDTTLTLTSSKGGSATLLIQVLRVTNTTLTLTLTPSTPQVSQPVSANGILSRNDNPNNYSGVSGVTVQLLDSNGAVVASGTTTSVGAYLIAFTAPAVAGSYTYHTYFAGSGLLASAVSRAQDLNLGAISPLIPLAVILGSTVYALTR